MGMSRSDNMRRIRSKNTVPELAVRKLVRSLGFEGYRLHRKDIPGKPDIAFVGKKVAIFVHGCFWHGHDCIRGVRKPKSNTTYWLPKIDRNKQRDSEHMATLELNNWRVMIIWECELEQPEKLKVKLSKFLSSELSR